jgi:hypothetical protein
VAVVAEPDDSDWGAVLMGRILYALAVAVAPFAFAVATTIAPAAQAQSGCTIRVTVNNGGAHPVSVRTNDAEARSRVAGIAGPWRRLSAGGWGPGFAVMEIRPGQGRYFNYVPQLGCSDPRQYRVSYTCLAGSRTGQAFDIRRPVSGWSAASDVTLPLGERC